MKVIMSCQVTQRNLQSKCPFLVTLKVANEVSDKIYFFICTVTKFSYF